MPAKTKPSPSSPKPGQKKKSPAAAKLAQKPPAKKPVGRPEFVPTDAQRALVEMMASLGIPQSEQALVIVDPNSKKAIAESTLKNKFKEEHRTGAVKAKIKGGTNLLKLTETSAAAAIFFAKVRLGMRENPPAAPPPPPEHHDATVVARNIAFALYVGANEKADPSKAAKPKAKAEA